MPTIHWETGGDSCVVHSLLAKFQQHQWSATNINWQPTTPHSELTIWKCKAKGTAWSHKTLFLCLLSRFRKNAGCARHACHQAQTQNKQLQNSLSSTLECLESIYQDIVGVWEEIYKSEMKLETFYDCLSGIIDKVHRQGLWKASWDINLDESDAPQEIIVELTGGDAQEVAPELLHEAQSGNVSGVEGWETAWEHFFRAQVVSLRLSNYYSVFLLSSFGSLFNYIVII